MAGKLQKVKIEDIDLVLRDAQVSNSQLNFLHSLLNKEDTDEEKRSAIESKSAMIFREMVSNLYTVLDQIYYFLYCHFQNDGNVSFSNDASQIKQPMAQKLLYSKNDSREPGCKDKRIGWVTEQCRKIFGDNCPEAKITNFKNNLLELQAIKEVDASGNVVETDGAPKLYYLSEFAPIESSNYKELSSVGNMNDWNCTIVFNLLHFFRNFTAHRSLIKCRTKEGYLNLETREFVASDQNLTSPWVSIANGSWILVPELSDLRREVSVTPKFYLHRLTNVSSCLLSFVRDQRNNVLLVIDDFEKYPYEVGWDSDDITFKQNDQTLGKCRWEEAHLWPVTNKK